MLFKQRTDSANVKIVNLFMLECHKCNSEILFVTDADVRLGDVFGIEQALQGWRKPSNNPFEDEDDEIL